MADVKIANLTTKTSPLDTDIMIIEDNSDTKKITYANLKSGLFSNPIFTGTQTLPSIVTNGIKFPATQVPSADPNTLDDYEEGTFTPTIIGGTTAGVGTYGLQGGHYTKLGNLVHCDMVIALSAHTGTGNMLVGGLPFFTKNNSTYRATANIGYVVGIVVPSGSYIVGRCSANSNEIILESMKDGSFVSAVAMDTSLTIYLSIDYLTN